jgi:hypothetical protein
MSFDWDVANDFSPEEKSGVPGSQCNDKLSCRQLFAYGLRLPERRRLKPISVKRRCAVY